MASIQSMAVRPLRPDLASSRTRTRTFLVAPRTHPLAPGQPRKGRSRRASDCARLAIRKNRQCRAMKRTVNSVANLCLVRQRATRVSRRRRAYLHGRNRREVVLNEQTMRRSAVGVYDGVALPHGQPETAATTVSMSFAQRHHLEAKNSQVRLKYCGESSFRGSVPCDKS